ncbi:MAG TPA: response regulator [Terriglobia bacterium]|nr:response regulator [Terriglobia bacterium]
MLRSQLDFKFWSHEPPKPPLGFSGEDDESRYAADGPEKLRVLIVDDELTIADTLVEILSGEGYDAMAAATGDSALASAQTFLPDIVISDVIMPGINGVELGIRIRRDLPRCRVILFSGQTETSDLLGQARKRGHEFEIIAKPIKPQTLLAMIRYRGDH